MAVLEQNELCKLLDCYLETEISNRKYPQLKRFFRCFADYEDVVMATLEKLYTKQVDLEEDSKRRENYIYAAVRNASHDFWTKQINKDNQYIVKFQDIVDSDIWFRDGYEIDETRFFMTQTIHQIAMNANLTEDELAIQLDLNYHGLSHQEIADKYKISLRTVGNRVKAIKIKMAEVNIYDYQ